MDQQKILNKAISITEIQMKSVKSGNKYALKDHEGRTFNFFTTKQDGSDTSVFSQFKNMGLKVGDTVQIGYVEDEFEIDGKKVISKKIINFRETNDTPTQSRIEAFPSNVSYSGASQRGSSVKDDAFWEKQAYEKCVSIWAAAWLQRGNTLAVVLKDVREGVLWNLFQAIKADGARRFSPASLEDANLEPELPIIQQEEEIDVEGIPF